MNETNPARRLTRSRDDRYIGGVAAGIANYFNLDPVLIRVGFVIGVAFGGVSVLAYLILLAMVPIEGDQSEPAASPSGTKRFLVIAGTVIVGIIALASIDGNGPASWFFGIGFPGFGIFIWVAALAFTFWLVKESTSGDNASSGAFGRSSEPGRTAPPPVVPPPVPTVSPSAEITPEVETEERPGASSESDAPTETMAPSPTQTAPTATMAAASGGGAPPPPARSRSSSAGVWRTIMWIALGIFGLILCGVAFIASAWITAESGAIPMASVLILLGLGMVFAGVKNRHLVSVCILAFALVIALPMAVVSLAGIRIHGEYGDIHEEPKTVGSIPAEGYEMAAGSLKIDMRKYPFRDGVPANLPVDSGFGFTQVVVPDDVCVTGDIDVKAGVVDVRNSSASGGDFDHDLGEATGKVRELAINGDMAVGYFEVIDESTWRWYEYDIPRGPNWNKPVREERKRAREACAGTAEPDVKAGKRKRPAEKGTKT